MKLQYVTEQHHILRSLKTFLEREQALSQERIDQVRSLSLKVFDWK